MQSQWFRANRSRACKQYDQGISDSHHIRLNMSVYGTATAAAHVSLQSFCVLAIVAPRCGGLINFNNTVRCVIRGVVRQGLLKKKKKVGV